MVMDDFPSSFRIARFVLLFIALQFTQSALADIHEVQHQPAQPKSNEAILVTTRLDDAKNVATVELMLQAVEPGRYIRKADAEYEKNWTVLAMKDDGQAGDARAGDGVYSLRFPGDHQKHRWLYRYRIVAMSKDGAKTVAPSPKSSSPNFAWFCYDGVPAWQGARTPNAPVQKFTAEFLATIKPYHLIAQGEDVATSQWDGNAHKKRFPGTFVYDGIVHDHIQFTNRGQGSAHIGGKNKWALKFNADEPVQLHDNAGKPYRVKWKGVDMNPGTHTPYLPVLRGIAGLDEALSFRAYQLAGVPSSSTHWVHWRVIDAQEEASKTSQYEGDLWGLYLAIGDIAQEILAEQQLPDGLLVSIQSGIKHQPKDNSAGQKEWDQFLGGMRSGPAEAWWRKNLNLEHYFTFHAINRLIGNVDIRPDGNHGYYRGPDGRWSPIPWDNDMCFIPRHHQPGHIDAIGCLNHPAIRLEYQARAREILDLFAADASPQGGQVGQLVAELGQTIAPAKQSANWAQLDDAMWNWHPRFNQKGSYFVNPAQGDHFGGRWERKLATNDFAGFQKYLIDFCTDSRLAKDYEPNDGNPQGYGWGYLAHEAKDEKIPARPTITRPSPDAVGRYDASSDGLAKGKWFIEWRVGQVGNGHYEIQNHWRAAKVELPEGRRMAVPVEVFKQPGTYRIRARLHDEHGRASHWSAPITETVR